MEQVRNKAGKPTIHSSAKVMHAAPDLPPWTPPRPSTEPLIDRCIEGVAKPTSKWYAKHVLVTGSNA